MLPTDHLAAVRQTLARLLAGEAVTVVHDPTADTASFDLTNRLLTLPDWQVSETTYSMLLCHEVGHARFSPAALTDTIRAEWPDYVPAAHGPLINVFEDLRIDRLIQHHYPGAVRTYAAAHADLVAAGILTAPPADAPLPLRVLARSRAVPGVVITPDEAGDAAVMAAPRDFAHVVALARAWAQAATPAPPQPDPQGTPTAQPGPAPTDATADPSDGDGTPTEADEADGTRDSVTPDGDAPAPAQSDAPDATRDRVTPADPLAGHRDPLADYVRQQTAVTPADGVTTYVLDRLPEGRMTSLAQLPADAAPLLADWQANPCRPGVEAQWATCKADAQTMAATFRVKVNARTPRQAGRTDAGRLNPHRLHAYRYTDRIFTTLQQQPKGVSHGLLLAVDLSDSMKFGLGYGTAEAGPVLTQMVTLVEFCRAVRIPYRVVGFTCEGRYPQRPTTSAANGRPAAVQPLSHAYVDGLRLLDLFRSSDTAAQHATRLTALGAWWSFITGNVTGRRRDFDCEEWAALGCTPLVEALTLLPDWCQSLGAVDRPFIALLTDGEPTNRPVWQAGRLSDPTSTRSYTAQPGPAYSCYTWDTPLWRTLLARVRTLTGAVLHNHFLTDLASARHLCDFNRHPQPAASGSATAVCLPHVGGFDLTICHIPADYVPARTRTSSAPTTRTARLRALSHSLQSRGDRTVLTTLAQHLAEAVAAPAA